MSMKTLTKCSAALALIAAFGPTLAGAADSSRLASAAATEDLAAVRSLLKDGADVNGRAVDGTTALHWMVRAENLEMVDMLLAAGADVNAADRYGVTPLYLACSLSNVPMMEKLLAAGANPNATDQSGETLLMIASHVAEPRAAQALLDHGANANAKLEDSGTTNLMVAVRDNQPDIVKLLLAHRAEVNLATAIGEKPPRRPAGAGGGSHGVGIIRGGMPESGAQTPATGGLTALMYAARDGHLDVVKMLAEAGADIEAPEANKITALQMAIGNNNMDVASYLLAKGANPNSADDYGRTPLWLAVEMRDLELGRGATGPDNGIDRARAFQMIKDLIAAGANVNARTTDYPPTRRYLMGLGDLSWVNFVGQTPFLRAALSGDLEVMHFLLDHGADPNIETEEGTTALMAAAGVNWVTAQTFTEGDDALLEAVKLCMELGGDVNHANSMGLTAAHGAANRGSDAILQFLYDHGAKLDAKDKEGRTPYVWAQGVFLATNAPTEKPSSMALIKKLVGEAQ